MKNAFRRYAVCFSVLAAAAVIMAAACLYTGSVSISAVRVSDVLLGKSSNASDISIIMKIRMPRMAAAAFMGGALAVSGYLLQTLFANPIAGPFILGISSGAKLTVAGVMIFFMQKGIMLSSAAMMTAAFAGSMLSMGLILLISGKANKPHILIICGVMIGYICSAATDLAVTFADDSNIVNLHNWSMGSFSGISAKDAAAASAVICVSLAAVMIMSKQIGAYRLGESYAQSMGMNIKLFRLLLILFSSILAACVTAFAGPVSFVGMAVPHLIKLLFGTSKPHIIIPASFLGGAVFCMFCDMLARIMFAPTELSISSVTAVFGAPVVIGIMIRKQSERDI